MVTISVIVGVIIIAIVITMYVAQLELAVCILSYYDHHYLSYHDYNRCHHCGHSYRLNQHV